MTTRQQEAVVERVDTEVCGILDECYAQARDT